MIASQISSVMHNKIPTRQQRARPTLPKTWHIATLAPGFDARRLQFPLYVATNESKDKIHVSSKEELDTLFVKYRDDESQKSASYLSSAQRRDSATGSLKLNPQLYRTDIDGISTISSSSSSSSSRSSAASSSSATSEDDEYDSPLSDHFVNGEIVCTGGLALESRDLTQIEDEARNVVFSAGRSVDMVVRSKYPKRKKSNCVKRFLSSFFRHFRGLR